MAQTSINVVTVMETHGMEHITCNVRRENDEHTNKRSHLPADSVRRAKIALKAVLLLR